MARAHKQRRGSRTVSAQTSQSDRRACARSAHGPSPRGSPPARAKRARVSRRRRAASCSRQLHRRLTEREAEIRREAAEEAIAVLDQNRAAATATRLAEYRLIDLALELVVYRNF